MYANIRTILHKRRIQNFDVDEEALRFNVNTHRHIQNSCTKQTDINFRRIQRHNEHDVSDRKQTHCRFCWLHNSSFLEITNFRVSAKFDQIADGVSIQCTIDNLVKLIEVMLLNFLALKWDHMVKFIRRLGSDRLKIKSSL